MSLGLGDLKKRRSSKPAKPAASPYVDGAGAWSKPWTAAELAQTPVRKKKSAPNLTSDWTLLYSGPVFWVDWNELTWLARMQSRLSILESQTERAVLRPIHHLRRFLKI